MTVLETRQQGPVMCLWLSRPQVKNALNGALIEQLHAALLSAEADPTVRVIVLAGRGTDFCSGADLGYMQAMASCPAQNHQASLALSALFQCIALCAKPVVARVQGACFAGALGLVCACDIVLAGASARFCLPEVRRGLIPATISPFVVQAMGVRAARRYFLTAEVFSASQAHEMGVVHEWCEDAALDARVDEVLASLLEAGPSALALSKRLVQDVQGMDCRDEGAHEGLARRLAEVRASAEAAEGMAAFVEKRKPSWVCSSAHPQWTS